MSDNSPVMLITGASRGIGRATALLAASQGYSIGINYLNNQKSAQDVAAQCKQLGARTALIQADVADSSAIVRMFEQLDEELGVLEVLVNNAGILEQCMRFDAMSAERVARILNTNVSGTMLCTQQAIKRMSTLHGGKGGSIVNISSRASVLGSANEYVDYAASKGAVDTFTVGVANEVASEGIRVNAVRPGLIETEIHASGGKPDRVDQLKHNVPMRRGGSAEEVANAVLWLASDASSYTTGSFVDVGGGR